MRCFRAAAATRICQCHNRRRCDVCGSRSLGQRQRSEYVERHIVGVGVEVQHFHMTIPHGGTGPEAGRLIRLMTVDDHPIYRGRLASLIGAYRDLQLIAEATNGLEAVKKYRQHRPDVTLMDLSMPLMGWPHACAALVVPYVCRHRPMRPSAASAPFSA